MSEALPRVSLLNVPLQLRRLMTAPSAGCKRASSPWCKSAQNVNVANADRTRAQVSACWLVRDAFELHGGGIAGWDLLSRLLGFSIAANEIEVRVSVNRGTRLVIP